jgi:hypothetical protein
MAPATPQRPLRAAESRRTCTEPPEAPEGTAAQVRRRQWVQRLRRRTIDIESRRSIHVRRSPLVPLDDRQAALLVRLDEVNAVPVESLRRNAELGGPKLRVQFSLECTCRCFLSFLLREGLLNKGRECVVEGNDLGTDGVVPCT